MTECSTRTPGSMSTFSACLVSQTGDLIATASVIPACERVRTMTLSPEQLAIRRTGISATDTAAIAGIHPYLSPIDVWLDKTGRKPPFAGNARTKWGNILEAPIRDDYAQRRGLRVEVPGTLEHPTETWAKATPDGVCYEPRNPVPVCGLEIKTHSHRVSHWYGTAGSDEVPPHELMQCQWNMYVAGIDTWDLVAFVDGQPTDYVIRRDNELIDMMREKSERFLVDHVRADRAPDPDGSPAYSRFLAGRKQQGADLLDIDDKPEVLEDVRSLRAVKAQLDNLQGQVELYTQRLKFACGDRSGLVWSEDGSKQKITYKAQRESTRISYQALYEDARGLVMAALRADSREAMQAALRVVVDDGELVARHTTKIAGTRSFLTPRSWTQSNKED